MEIIRRNTDYALRALLHLAANRAEKPVSARRIASEQDIGYAITCKLLQQLQQAGLVRSHRGANGGFSLARAPRRVRLRTVVEAIQGEIKMSQCLVGVTRCRRWRECGIRRALAALQIELEAGLERLTLADFMPTKRPRPPIGRTSATTKRQRSDHGSARCAR